MSRWPSETADCPTVRRLCVKGRRRLTEEASEGALISKLGQRKWTQEVYSGINADLT